MPEQEQKENPQEEGPEKKRLPADGVKERIKDIYPTITDEEIDWFL